MRKIFIAVIGVALLAACKETPQSMVDTSYILDNQHIESAIEDVDDVECPKGYYFYYFEADSILQKEVESNIQDTTQEIDYAALPFQTDTNHFEVINAIDELVFKLGKDSVENLILKNNRDFLDIMEAKFPDIRIYTLQTMCKDKDHK